MKSKDKEEEFDLSEKGRELHLFANESRFPEIVYPEKDVKEFIKRLKKEIMGGLHTTDYIWMIIDKLAGEKFR